MRRLWIAFTLVMLVSFLVLGWIGTRIYQEAPPLPNTKAFFIQLSFRFLHSQPTKILPPVIYRRENPPQLLERQTANQELSDFRNK